jgi:TniQ
MLSLNQQITSKEISKLSAMVQPLLNRFPLLPDESLPSLIMRLAVSNYYEPPSVLWSILSKPRVEIVEYRHGSNFKLGCLANTSMFERLAGFTMLGAFDLYKATAHRFTHVLTPPEDTIKSIELSSGIVVDLLAQGVANLHIRAEHACQFCPHCLCEAVYHRLIWIPVACAACLQHKCLLVNSCPQCGSTIKIQSIVELVCSKCEFALTAVPTDSVEKDSFGLFTQEIIQTWLTKGITPSFATYSVLEQTPRNLYRILYGLRSSLIDLSSGSPLLHHLGIRHSSTILPDSRVRVLTPYQSYCLNATAFKGLINWPNGFHAFLTAYRNSEKRRRPSDKLEDANSFSYSLRSLNDSWLRELWKQSSLEFVQQAFDQYLVENYTPFSFKRFYTRFKEAPQSEEKLRHANIIELATLLNRSHTRLRFRTKSGLHTVIGVVGKSRTTPLKHADDLMVEDKRSKGVDCHKQSRTISIEDVQDQLSLTRYVVIQLAHAGFLTARKDRRPPQKWRFNSDGVDECLDRIFAIVRDSADYPIAEDRNEGGFLSLKKTTMLLSKVGLDASSIILQVAEGKLPAYLPENGKHGLGNLLFARSDIEAYAENVKVESGWIGQNEAAKLLKIGIPTLIEWVKAGRITPVASHCAYYFDKDAIEKLATDRVKYKEAAMILGIHRGKVLDLVNQDRIQALSGPAVDGSAYYVFSRQALLKWRYERVTLAEAKLQLGVSTIRIVHWVKQGKLIPLEDKMLTPWYFSKQALLQLPKNEMGGSTHCTV